MSNEQKAKLIENNARRRLQELKDKIAYINKHNEAPSTKEKDKISNEVIEDLRSQIKEELANLKILENTNGIAEKKREEKKVGLGNKGKG